MSENVKPVPLAAAGGFVWTPASDEAGAIARFVEKYGHEPARSEVVTGRLWLGPVPERRFEWVENSQ